MMSAMVAEMALCELSPILNPPHDPLIMKSSLPINGNSVPLDCQAKALLKSSSPVLSLYPTSNS